MNGYELVRAIRREEQRAHRSPVIVLGFTANAQPEEIERCKQAGMDDCLFKPLTLTALSQWVEGISPAFSSAAFSIEGLQQLTGGNPAMSLRLLTELLRSNRLDREELLGLTRSGDLQSFLDIAHKIKGAARIVQATRLIDSCESLEEAIHQAFQPDVVTDCILAMERAMLELDQALQHQIRQHDNSTMVER